MVTRARGKRGFAGTFVDLFAGCGGLSLGLEQAGFTPIFVSELNADAMATYLMNRRRRFPHLERFSARDINEITGRPLELDGLRGALTSHFATRDIDLVVGGPPCQGFSRIGHRRSFSVSRRDIPSNHLYVEMAKVIRSLRPRAFLFENVQGLLHARWSADGDPGEIWADVLRQFGSIDGYHVAPALVQAKDYGVPQNRPRLLVLGVRSDVRFEPAWAVPAEGLLPQPSGRPPDAIDFLGDLVDPEWQLDHVTRAYPGAPANEVQEWYRRDPDSGRVAALGEPVSEHVYAHHSSRIVSKFDHMIRHDGDIRSEDQTRKFGQRVIPATWGPKGPMLTATSLPDDYVHFSQPRTLTVREWARWQTFPDWYEFAGPRTTGGRLRGGDPSRGVWHRAVPKFTQIGNAVPVRLAHAIGEHLHQVLGTPRPMSSSTRRARGSTLTDARGLRHVAVVP